MNTRILIYMCAVMLFAGCTKSFDDINTNQHQLTDEELQADYQNVGAFFSQMVNRVVLFDDGSGNCLSSDYQVAQGLSADAFSGYLALTGTWRNGVHNGSYSFVSGWYDQLFTRAFSEVMPAWQRVTTVAGQMGQPAVAVLATIVKVEALHRVTDMYGPIPYIHFGSGTLGTAYDRQQEVYNRFFAELDSAIDVLKPLAESGGTLLPDYDNVYEGNVARWVKFANTLRLRLALRVAYADPTLAQREAEKSAACSLGFIETAAERAQLLHGRLTYFHPNYDMAYNFNYLIDAAAHMKKTVPGITLIGTGYSYLRAFAPQVAAGAVSAGMADAAGFGRMAFAYPDFARDILENGTLDASKVCLTCSQCTAMMRKIHATGCPIRDREVYLPMYKELFPKE